MSGILYYVTGFWKTNPIVALGLFHFIGAANSYIHKLPFIVPLSGLADWSDFLEQVLPINSVNS